MIERLALRIHPVLESPIVKRTRRNHALEHATVTLLSQRKRGLKMAGHSSDSGFTLIGDVPTADVERAAHDALSRLQKGEHNLAVHPNCGTNLITSATLTTLVGFLGFGIRPQRISLDRVSWTMVLMMIASVAAQPIGMALQRHITTEGDPGDMNIVSVTRRTIRTSIFKKPVVVHRITTQQG